MESPKIKKKNFVHNIHVPQPLYKWSSSFCIQCHRTSGCDTNRNKGTFQTVLTILRQKAALFLVSPHHSALATFTKIYRAKQGNANPRQVSHSKQNYIMQFSSLPYYWNLPLSKSCMYPFSSPNMEQPQTKRVQQKSMSTEWQAFL